MVVQVGICWMVRIEDDSRTYCPDYFCDSVVDRSSYLKAQLPSDLVDAIRDWATAQGASPAAAQTVLAMSVLLSTTMLATPSLFC